MMSFYLKVIQKAFADKKFRNHILHEGWLSFKPYFPARLVTRPRDYVFCRKLGQRGGGRWLPPLALTYRVCAYGVLYDEVGQLLMVANPSLNFRWNLPGGQVNKGETLEAGLQREFEEETGLLVRIGEVLHNTDSFHIMPTGRAVHAVMHFYRVEVTGGTFLPEGNGYDTTQVEYVDLDQISQYEVDAYVLLKEVHRKARLNAS